MTSAASRLCGKRLLLASTENDQLNLQLDGASLNIYNPVTWRGTIESPSALVGRAVEAVEETSHHLDIRFTGGVVLEIDLRDAAYSGPEAAVLSLDDGRTIIW
jgi:hypothetical protein